MFSATTLSNLSKTWCFHCQAADLHHSKTKSWCFLKSTALKQAERELIHTRYTHKLCGCGFHISFSCTEAKHNKETIGQDPTKCEGCPWHDPGSECLRTSITWQIPSAMESSRAAGDFRSCQGDTASKPSAAAQQDETNTAGTWKRLIQGVILAGRQAKIVETLCVGCKENK